LQARYADAVFRKDYAAFADCFTADAEWRIAGAVLTGRVAIRGALERIMGDFERVVMTFGPPALEVGRGEVAARTYVIEQRAFRTAPPSMTVGRYYERVVRDGDAWRFRWRLFQLLYVGPPDLSGDLFDHPDYGPPPGMPPADAPTFSSAALLAAQAEGRAP
jgi:hypothetical protein